jgi:hypothetical protein
MEDLNRSQARTSTTTLGCTEITTVAHLSLKNFAASFLQPDSIRRPPANALLLIRCIPGSPATDVFKK